MIYQKQFNITYFDETWPNQNNTSQKYWQDSPTRRTYAFKQHDSKNHSPHFLKADTKHRYIPNCRLIFQINNSGNYHSKLILLYPEICSKQSVTKYLAMFKYYDV